MRKLASGALIGCISVSSLWAQCDHLEFARALEGQGYTTLTIESYEEALKAGDVKGKAQDDVFLSLYKLYGRLATQMKGKAAEEATAKGEKYFSQIKDSSNDVVQLEKVKAGMTALRTTAHAAQSAAKEELPGLKAKAKSAFERIAKVTDKIRKESRIWLDEFDSKDEKEQKKLKNDYRQMSELEINANLQFGEACVLYASIAGHKDPDVLKWLKEMSKGYEDFISNNFGSFAAIVGGVYYGQVCILLGEFTDDYGSKVDGLKAGATSFEDAIAGLEEFSGQRNLKSYVDNWMLQAHTKHAQALEIVGQKEKAIDVLKSLFDVMSITEATPRSNESHHDQMMYALQNLCSQLKASYEGGNKARVNDFAQFVLQGFNFAKKVDSRWLPNFRKLLGDLPADDSSIVETLDIANMKADNLFSAASSAQGEKRKDLFFQASLKYKKVIEMVLAEPDRMDEFFPKSAYRLGKSYFEQDNYLLALGIYLRAVDLYPSSKFNEKEYPEIYGQIRRCVTSAKGTAIKRYILAGKTRFDQKLYEQTLTIISQQFPEEGGDPEFWLGYLKKSSGDYQGAIDLLSKLGKTSKMYFKAQYALANCDELMMNEDVESGKLKDDALKSARAKIAARYSEVIKLASAPVSKPEDMQKKDYDFMLNSQKETLAKATQRMASLSYQAGEYKKAHKTLSEIMTKASEVEKFNALKMMISCSYSLESLEMFDQDLAKYAKLKADSELSKGMIASFKAKAEKMKANLIIQQKLNPLLSKMEGLKGAALKAVEKQCEPVYVETADLLFSSLKSTGEKDENLLKQIIGYYYSTESAREKALEAMNLYFKWYPQKPALGDWHAELIGGDAGAWDKKLGGVRSTIKLPMVQKVYDRFLDEMFDAKDYSKMSISMVKATKRETGDQPRNYQVAMKTYAELEGYAKKDLTFGRQGWPKVAKLKDDLKEANGYYSMRYMQAECLSLLKRYDEATEVFKELSKYYVEYPSIRIELAKAEFAQKTQESYAKASKIFQELLKVVPGPTQGSAYSPREFFSLQLWYARAQVAMAGDAPSAKLVVDIWKTLRSNVYQDLGYIAMEPQRFTQLKISSAERANHVALIEDLKSWVDEVIFPVLSKSGDALASDSWKSILGAE